MRDNEIKITSKQGKQVHRRSISSDNNYGLADAFFAIFGMHRVEVEEVETEEVEVEEDKPL